MPQPRHLAFAICLAATLVLSACADNSAESFLQRGKAYFTAGDFTEARIELRNAAQRDPQLAEAYYLLALIAAEQSDPAKAFENFTLTAELDSHHLEARLALIELYLQGRKFDEAQRVLAEARALVPADPRLGPKDAAILLGRGKFDAAEARIHQGILEEARNPDWYTLRAALAQTRGDADTALVALNQALELQMNAPQLLVLRAGLHRAAGNLAALEKDLRALVTLAPSAERFAFTLAKLLVDQGRRSEADEVMRGFVRAHPEHVSAKKFHIALAPSEVQAMSLLDQYIAQDLPAAALRLHKVQRLLAQGKKDSAQNVLEQIITDTRIAKEAHRDARAVAAELALEQGDIERLIELIQSNLGEQLDHEASLLVQARYDIARGAPTEAIASLRTVLRNHPNSEQGLVLLGRAYQASGSPLLADDAFRQALVSYPGSAEAVTAVTQRLLREGDLRRAEVALDRAVKASPDNLKVRLLQIQIKIRQRDWAGAEASLQHLDKVEALAEQRHFYRGLIAREQHGCSEAMSLFRLAVDGPRPLAPALRALVSCWESEEDSGAVFAYLRELRSKHPRFIEAYWQTSELHRRQGASEKAKDALEKALLRRPDWITGHGAVAGLLETQGDLAGAAAALERGIRANRRSGAGTLSQLLANFYQRHGETEKAVAEYEMLLEDGVYRPIAINNYANLLLASSEPSDWRRALAMAERLSKERAPALRDTLGYALLRNGRAQDAESVLRDAAERAGREPEIHWHLGLALVALDRPEEARVVLRRSLSMSPPATLKASIESALADIEPPKT